MRPQASASSRVAARTTPLETSVSADIARCCTHVRAATIPNSRGLGLDAVAWDGQRVLDDLGRLALRAPTRVEFFDEAALRLKRAVPFDGACWHTLDPGSDLITQHH